MKIVRIAREEWSAGRNTAERGKAVRIWFVFELTTTAELFIFRPSPMVWASE